MYVKRNVHDVAYLSLFYADGVMADMRVSWLDPNKIRKITIVGSKKMLVYDDIEPQDKVKIYDKGVEEQPYTDTLEEFNLAYRYGEVTSYPINWQEPLRMECQDFLESISNGGKPRSDAYLGLKVVQVLEAAQRSLDNGGTQEVIQW
jgi:predicted dehydrogenase